MKKRMAQQSGQHEQPVLGKHLLCDFQLQDSSLKAKFAALSVWQVSLCVRDCFIIVLTFVWEHDLFPSLSGCSSTVGCRVSALRSPVISGPGRAYSVTQLHWLQVARCG